jgi:hypothetical protein
MKLRVSILDVTALIVVLVVMLLPARAMDVSPAYPTDQADEIELYQARLAADPGDGAAAEELAARLARVQQTDWALRAAGDATRDTASPTHWRALLAVSSVHAERIEIPAAFEWAKKALLACDADGALCPLYERVRLQMYVRELEAGIAAIHKGIDPAADPFAFRRAIDTAYPRARLKGTGK